MMMDLRGVVGALMVSACALAGCHATVKDSRVYADMAPSSAPKMAGTYDFDLLDAVEGKGCVTAHDTTQYGVAVAGTALGVGMGLVPRAEAAAVFDALSKVKGADLVYVTRSKTEGDVMTGVCTTVYGRAVRLKKGPTILGKGELEAPAAPAASAAEPKK